MGAKGAMRVKSKPQEPSSSRQNGQAPGRDPFNLAVGSLCQVHRIPFEIQLLQRHYPAPHTLTSLLGALQQVGLELRYAKLSPDGLPIRYFEERSFLYQNLNATIPAGSAVAILGHSGALLKRPKVLIFDEAIAHLDSETSEQFANTVNQLKGKVTVLFSTHQRPGGLRVDHEIALQALVK